MRKFKITATPPGQAPEWVREAWVGLELPMEGTQREDQASEGVLGGRPENTGGFMVNGRTAIELLKQKSPEAAAWWHENAPHVLQGRLVFKQEACQEIG